MINQSELDRLASMVSSVPCKVCGSAHPVALKLVHSFSNDRPVVSIGFPDKGNTCGDFQRDMTAFINLQLNRLNMGNCPLDRI